MVDRREPSSEQVKAVANPLRLRILRLCNDREWTNQELARRLGKDPATILYHLRLLVAAGLLEPAGVRQGSRGAYEKPYRSTGVSWQLQFQTPPVDGREELTMLAAFREELGEAGNDSISELTRFHLHLDQEEADRFGERFVALVDEFQADDESRRQRGHPGYGGIMVLHRLADPPPP